MNAMVQRSAWTGVSCIVPAYNEETTVGALVETVRRSSLVGEVIVVSDGSTDATPARAEAAGASRVISMPRNSGKGAAVWTAVQQVRGEVVLFLDADLCGVEPGHIRRLLLPVLNNEADMTVGDLLDDPLHELFSGLSGQRALRRDLLIGAQSLARTGFGLELALDGLARQRAARVVRVPLHGITHRRKRQKYGTVPGLRMQVRASRDLARQASRAVRSTVLPGRLGRPRRVLSLVAAMVLLVTGGPLFLAHPTRASESRLTALPAPAGTDRLLVIVAHPDDEVIGAGGLIATARAAGVPVSVLILTNGDGNRINAALVGRRMKPRAEDFVRAGRLRQTEAVLALEGLGVPRGEVFFGGFPDRGLSRVMRAAAAPVRSAFTRLDQAAYADTLAPAALYTRPALVELLQRAISVQAPTIIVTHAPFDTHSDHRATFDAVMEAAGDRRVYTFLVHASGFPRPLRYVPGDVLMPPAGLGLPPSWTWARFDLPAPARAAKARALGAYRSQRSSPYLRLLLPAFIRTNELFAVPPDPSTHPR